MNKGTRVVHESHCLGLGQASAVAAGNEGHAQTVEAGVDAARIKKRIDSAILVSIEETCFGHRSILDLLKRRHERGMNGNGNFRGSFSPRFAGELAGVHLEQMDDGHWLMSLDGRGFRRMALNFYLEGKRIRVTAEDDGEHSTGICAGSKS